MLISTLPSKITHNTIHKLLLAQGFNVGFYCLLKHLEVNGMRHNFSASKFSGLKKCN